MRADSCRCCCRHASIILIKRVMWDCVAAFDAMITVEAPMSSRRRTSYLQNLAKHTPHSSGIPTGRRNSHDARITTPTSATPHANSAGIMVGASGRPCVRWCLVSDGVQLSLCVAQGRRCSQPVGLSGMPPQSINVPSLKRHPSSTASAAGGAGGTHTPISVDTTDSGTFGGNSGRGNWTDPGFSIASPALHSFRSASELPSSRAQRSSSQLFGGHLFDTSIAEDTAEQVQLVRALRLVDSWAFDVRATSLVPPRVCVLLVGTVPVADAVLVPCHR